MKKTRKVRKTTERLTQLERALQSLEDWRAGKIKLRTWVFDEAGNRRMLYQSYEDYLARDCGQVIKSRRGDLEPS